MNEILAAGRFWLALLIFGAAAMPLANYIFGKLPDRGYAFTKMLGLLLASYTFWLLSTLGILANSTGGIVVGLMAVAGASYFCITNTDIQPLDWLRNNWRYVLTVELLFLIMFGVWVWVRAQNPNITGTEKPMEFAFLNSVTRSPNYPPLDPWLSGFSISYYYFGYVMVSAVARIAAVPTPIAFNLGVAWLVAGAGIGGFGMVYNLLAHRAGAITQELNRLAVICGLLAAVAIPLAGNGQMLLEIMHGNQIGSDAFWAWLDIRDINGPATDSPRFLTGDGAPTSGWWWWRSSRVIHEHYMSGRVEEGLTPIAEFPGFSFVLGDMHPHVLALPYAFLLTALALAWYLRDDEVLGERQPAWSVSDWRRYAEGLLNRFGRLNTLISALILGGLAFLNTWDVPIHLFIIVGAYILSRWRARGGWDHSFWTEAAVLGAGLGILAYILYFPFFLGLSSQAGAPYILPMMMRPTRIVQFLVIFGMPLFAIIMVTAVSWYSLPNKWAGLRPALRLGIGLPLGLIAIALLFSFGIAISSAGAGLVQGIANEIGVQLQPRVSNIDIAWAAAAIIAILPTYLLIRLQYIFLTLMLSALLVWSVLIWHARLNNAMSDTTEDEELMLEAAGLGSEDRQQPIGITVLPFVMLLVLTAVMLSLGPEYVYLKDNFGQRLNTIFKFYYQAWILYGIAALYGVGYLWRNHRPAGIATAAVYGPLLAIAMLFPVYGSLSRQIENRGPAGPNQGPATLNGLYFMERFHPDEYAAVEWLQSNTNGAPVILEATGNPYSDYARVSANTGLPTVLGWANHEFQWRGDSTDEPGQRIAIVNELYETIDWTRTEQLLNQYQVEYIFVGRIERNDHNPLGLEKFAQNLEIAYQNETVTIYRWQPQ